jgi:hypothetical protein
MGRSAEASEALNRAIGLCEDQAVRDYLGRGGCRAHPERCRFTHKSCSRAARRVGVPCRGPSARRAHRQPNDFVPSLMCGDDRVTGAATPTGKNFRLRLPQRRQPSPGETLHEYSIGTFELSQNAAKFFVGSHRDRPTCYVLLSLQAEQRSPAAKVSAAVRLRRHGGCRRIAPCAAPGENRFPFLAHCVESHAT